MVKRALVLSIAASGLAAAAALAQGAGASAGVYSPAQAERGGALYAAECARCHGAGLEGLDVSPPLTGPRFLANWTGQPLAALSTRIRTTMPLDQPGKLGQAAAAELTAYVLKANGYPAGQADLPPGASAQQAFAIDAPPAR